MQETHEQIYTGHLLYHGEWVMYTYRVVPQAYMIALRIYRGVKPFQAEYEVDWHYEIIADFGETEEIYKELLQDADGLPVNPCVAHKFAIAVLQSVIQA